MTPRPWHRALEESGGQVRVELSRGTAELMDRGLLEFRMVGTHHRVRVSSIVAFRDAERPSRRSALDELAAVQNELGLSE